mgnify:CR=1 FL=1
MSPEAITRRDFLRYAGAGLAAMAVPGVLSSAFAADRKPNIILIVADDLGYGELGCQGCKDIPTPNIDSIAANGARFTNGYVSCPVCSPTRAGLMTGRYQQRFGHELNPGPPGLAQDNFGLPLSETLLPARLKTAGYVTGMSGKWHLGYKKGYLPLDRGFDEFFGFPGGAHAYSNPQTESENPVMKGDKPYDEKEYLTDAFGREAAAFVEKHKARPFFLYLPFNAVHGPLEATEKYESRFSGIKDGKRRTFAAMLSAMDDNVGKVLDAVRRNGLENDTVIFFISDNGGPTKSTTSANSPLKGFKGDTYEGGIRVPYMVQWKGKIPAGKTYDQPVISLDIAPTACAIAGAKTDGAKFDGANLMPFLTGRTSAVPHEALYWRYGSRYAIREGNWKLVDNGTGKFELYDLSRDVGESKDLAADKPNKVKKLTARLKQWESELVKPLWQMQREKKEKPGKTAGEKTSRQQKNK